MNNGKTIGIYKYENKINGKIYIGQSVNIQERYNQHLYDALNRPEKSTGIDIAINKYGINNFTFEILEECSKDLLNEREKYWIQYYNSYKDGYNRTVGGNSVQGENHPRAILNSQEVWIIRELYGQKKPFREVYALFEDKGITKRGFKKIWDCETWTDIHTDVYTKENKEWHRQNKGHSDDQIGKSSLNRALKQEEINLIVEDFKKGLNINQLAKKYNRDNGIIQKYLANPVEIKTIKYHGRRIKNINTNQIFSSISSAAKWAKCGATTLTRHLSTDKIAGKVPETNEPAEWEEIF